MQKDAPASGKIDVALEPIRVARSKIWKRSLKEEEKNVNKMMKRAAGLILVATPALAVAQEPAQNISTIRHPNLAAAQDLSRQAFDRLTAAQAANEFDMGGHAARAKALLQRANQEIKLAALAANGR